MSLFQPIFKTHLVDFHLKWKFGNKAEKVDNTIKKIKYPRDKSLNLLLLMISIFKLF